MGTVCVLLRYDCNANLVHGGVYFSKNAMFSINHYSRPTTQYWKNSALRVQRCVTMAEIINLPGQFVSRHPHFVVANTEWIAWYVVCVALTMHRMIS